MKRQVVALISAYLALNALILALMTNWFRYSLSLEGAYVLLIMLACALIAIGFAVSAYRRHHKNSAISLAAILLLFSIVLMSAHQNAFGPAVPLFYLNHTVSSGTDSIEINGRVISYSLILENPFSKHHKEYLNLR